MASATTSKGKKAPQRNHEPSSRDHGPAGRDHEPAKRDQVPVRCDLEHEGCDQATALLHHGKTPQPSGEQLQKVSALVAQAREKEAEIRKVNRRINAEVRKLSQVLSDLPEDRLSAADGVIKRAAYMRITLEDYELDLIRNGHTEMFTQSEKTDPYERERPVARLYNTMLRNYVSTMKQLFDMLPEGKPSDSQVVDPAYEKFFGR